MDPLFAVLTEPQAERMYARAFTGVAAGGVWNSPRGRATSATALERDSVRRARGFRPEFERLRGAGWTWLAATRLSPAVDPAAVRSRPGGRIVC
jgi:hypothetical protein